MADPIQNNTEVKPECDGIDEISTANIWIIMACLTEGGLPAYDKFDRSDPKRVKLVVRGKGLKKVVDDWWSGSSKYRQYAEYYRDVKEWIRPVEVRHVIV